jgi:hypothetical protein
MSDEDKDLTEGLSEDQAAEVERAKRESGEMDAANQANRDREKGGSGAI